MENLDCMTQEELIAFWEKNKDGDRFQRNLASYARNKADAIECRRAGKINEALRIEDVCDRIYDRLPEPLKL